MFGGLALIGVITATVAAWIITLTSADGTEPKVVPMEETINAALAKAEASKASCFARHRRRRLCRGPVAWGPWPPSRTFWSRLTSAFR